MENDNSSSCAHEILQEEFRLKHFETKVCINRDVCITFEEMKKEMLTDQDKLLFCPNEGMIMKVDFNYEINKFMIDIYCVNSEMAESAIMHNNWLNVKHKFNLELTEYEIYFYLFNHKINIHFERDESYVVYSGKNIKTKVSHYDIYLEGPNPYRPISKVKRVSQFSEENVTEYIETRKYINYLKELGYHIFRDDNFSKGLAIFPSFNCPHYILLNIWEPFISKNSVEEQYMYDEKIEVINRGSIVEGHGVHGETYVGSIRIQGNNIALFHPFREPFIVELTRKNTKSARGF